MSKIVKRHVKIEKSEKGVNLIHTVELLDILAEILAENKACAAWKVP